VGGASYRRRTVAAGGLDSVDVEVHDRTSTVDRRPSAESQQPMRNDSHIRPLDTPRLGDEVAQMLRRAIISGELEPGTHLVESVLSERFQVSRAPVRDGLKELASEGLVESRRRGVFVKALTQEDVREIHNLRRMLEFAALEIAVERFGDEDVAELDRHVGAMESAGADGGVSEFAAADLRFHRALFERGGNRRLLRVWQSFSQTFRIITEITDAGNVDFPSIAADHRRILDAIARHDLEEAREELTVSLARGERVFERRFEPDGQDGVEAVKGGGRD